MAIRRTIAEFSDDIATADIADDAVTTAKILASNVTTAKIADDAVTLAKMAGGTDGQVITYDASGDPVAVGPGTSGQLLQSAGAGAPPTFATVSGGKIIKISSKLLSGGTTLTVVNGIARDNDTDDLDITATAGNKLHIFISGGRISFTASAWQAIGISVQFGDPAQNTDYRSSVSYIGAAEAISSASTTHTVGSGITSLKIKRHVWDKEGGGDLYWLNNESTNIHYLVLEEEV